MPVLLSTSTGLKAGPGLLIITLAVPAESRLPPRLSCAPALGPCHWHSKLAQAEAQCGGPAAAVMAQKAHWHAAATRKASRILLVVCPAQAGLPQLASELERLVGLLGDAA